MKKPEPIEQVFEKALLKGGKFLYLPLTAWEDYQKARSKGTTNLQFAARLEGASYEATQWQRHPMWGILIAIKRGGQDLFRPDSTSPEDWARFSEQIATINQASSTWYHKDFIVLPSGTVVTIQATRVEIYNKSRRPHDPGLLLLLKDNYPPARLRKLRRQAEDHLRKGDKADIVRVAKFLKLK